MEKILLFRRDIPLNVSVSQARELIPTSSGCSEPFGPFNTDHKADNFNLLEQFKVELINFNIKMGSVVHVVLQGHLNDIIIMWGIIINIKIMLILCLCLWSPFRHFLSSRSLVQITSGFRSRLHWLTRHGHLQETEIIPGRPE